MELFPNNVHYKEAFSLLLHKSVLFSITEKLSIMDVFKEVNSECALVKQFKWPTLVLTKQVKPRNHMGLDKEWVWGI